ncbi:hypothetical protein [Cryptosporangium aurantiacum]|uniref:Uncharacterized protein n=1 Tax=Cryptosporangium aurantiacum TaxID=134849 RepID=A0A1M7R8V3_9ACTN|nr:hypothetical protein [Cryptosporangium aurantiacum]SHN42591.1 hypothetical protein SAMN05443668_108260 [Cryptosporangium aurantiacum]
MQREHPSEPTAAASGASTTEVREFWVRVAIDGTARVIRVVARSPQDALRRFPQDLHRGGRLQYSTADGDLVVEWGNVATLEVGPIVRVVRIVER